MCLKIDTHQHFWHWREEDHPWMASDTFQPLRRNFLPDDLAPVLEQHDVAATIAVQARGCTDETRLLLELADTTPWMVGVIGWLDLQANDVDSQLESLRQHHPCQGGKLLGFRHQVQDEADAATWLQRPAVSRGLDALQRAGFVYELLLLPTQLSALEDIVRRYDAHTLVLDHLAKPPIARMKSDAALFEQWRRALLCLQHQSHVVLKLSGLVTEADWQQGLDETEWSWLVRCLDAALDIAGPQRLMWGSDWPVCTLAASYGDVSSHFEQWVRDRLSPTEQRAVWYENALCCYQLPDIVPLPSHSQAN